MHKGELPQLPPKESSACKKSVLESCSSLKLLDFMLPRFRVLHWEFDQASVCGGKSSRLRVKAQITNIGFVSAL